MLPVGTTREGTVRGITTVSNLLQRGIANAILAAIVRERGTTRIGIKTEDRRTGIVVQVEEEGRARIGMRECLHMGKGTLEAEGVQHRDAMAPTKEVQAGQVAVLEEVAAAEVVMGVVVTRTGTLPLKEMDR